MNRELRLANLTALEAELVACEGEQARLLEFGNSLAIWHAKQSNTLFGALSTHIDEQISKADADLAAAKKEIDVETPDEKIRIELRKAFHRRLLRSLRFDFRLILFVLLFPKVVDFLDNLQYATLVGSGIYPILAGSIFATVGLFVMLMRLRRGKTLWPRRRIGKWLVWSGVISLIVGFWNLLSPLIHLWLLSPFFPSIWQVLGFSLGWFLVIFAGAILTYHAGFRAHWNEIAFARAMLEWASRGTLHTRAAKFTLTQNRKQIHYFANLLGHHLRKPWVNPTDDFSDDRWDNLAAKFPPAIKVALAVESVEGSAARPAILSQTIDRIYASASAKGWRKANFERVLEAASRELGLGMDFALALDQDSPAQPNGSRAKLLELVKDEAFLKGLGSAKHRAMMGELQKSLLETAEILVRRVKPQLGQPDVLKWDEHLASVIGDPKLGSPSLAQFAFKELSRDGHNDKVRTVIYGPKKLIAAAPSDGVPSDSTVELRAVNSGDQSGVDLVLRIDLAGIDKAIPANTLRLPLARGLVTDPADSKRCPSCGRLHCPEYSSGRECTWSGI